MTYTAAKKLRENNIIRVKKTSEELCIKDIDLREKDCYVLGNDGNVYHHRELQ